MGSRGKLVSLFDLLIATLYIVALFADVVSVVVGARTLLAVLHTLGSAIFCPEYNVPKRNSIQCHDPLPHMCLLTISMYHLSSPLPVPSTDPFPNVTSLALSLGCSWLTRVQLSVAAGSFTAGLWDSVSSVSVLFEGSGSNDVTVNHLILGHDLKL